MLLAGITIVFALAWCAAGLLRRASAGLRHLVWTCAFAAVLLLAPLRWRVPHRIVAPALPAIPAAPLVITPSGAVSRFDALPTLPIMLGLWAAGTAVLFLRLVRNSIRFRSIVRGAHGAWPILTTSRVRGPLIAGVWRPVILLPRSSETWNISRRRAVLAHEAAHIRRRDPLILLAAHIATAIYWFHPLCWLAAARLRSESERACDDAALRIGLRPSGYAGHLLDLACRFDTQLAIPMATTSNLESRVKSILDPMTNRSVPPRAGVFAAIALTAAVLAPLTTFTLTAQQAAGAAGISGTVTDPTGAVVARAQLTAVNGDLGNQEVTASGPDGTYAFSNIPGGHYTVEVQVPGFATLQLKDLVLVNGGKLEANARLVVGGMKERITVAGQGSPRRETTNAAVPRRPIRVGGNVQAANLLEQAKPVYPADLQAQGIEGTVLLSAVISKAGIPHSLTVQNSAVNQAFVNAAMNAVSQWRYRPTLLNGEPIEVITTVEVDFKLSSR
jgi:TonB family protein